ncbi:ER membrane protein, putative [Actinidia rufa]|uniref:ER membrane protein, putative n=1 Tax=Actinidia rufa TaxID=165716 RepID=A0A7J0FN71_9ERIC|nr:ER membrane protein, putative [Actinidia rufa]
MGKIGLFDLEKHFAFYGAYHRNPINIAIHTVFVWPILFTAGSLAAFLCFICWVFSSYLASLMGLSLAWKVVLAAQLVCWTGQFIGHGVFEKRAPALLTNLSQAFLMAPFFVLLEALQTLFGYEPYPGFQVSVQAKIDAEISEWQEKKKKLIS